MIVFKIISESWNVLGEMAIYLLFGFFVAGLLSVLISPATVERHLGGRGIWPVIKATLVGVPLPLCSCGVIPVATSFRRHGASKGATTSFLISTPETGVDSILVTYSLLGAVFAIFRPVVAIVNGIFGGILVELFDRKPVIGDACALTPCEDPCCDPKDRRLHGWFYRMMKYGFVTLPADIGLQLFVGILVAGLITAVVPPHYLAQSFLGGGIGAMVVMMLVGIPTYVCASASVPLAMALMSLGVSPGAALVFLITGPASNAASIAAMWKILGRRTVFLYLFSLIVTALTAGLMLDYLFTIPGISAVNHETHEMFPEWFKAAGAVVLLMLILVPLGVQWQRRRREFPLDSHDAAAIVKDTGHCCNGCENKGGSHGE